MPKIEAAWCRYDRRFPSDSAFNRLPARHRLAAYGFLLALNGEAYDRGRLRPPATGRLSLLEVEAVAEQCGCHDGGPSSKTLISVLQEAGLVRVQDRILILTKFFKWSPELTPEQSAKRTVAASKAAQERWSQDDSNHAPLHAVADASAHAVPHQGVQTRTHAISHAIFMQTETETVDRDVVPIPKPLSRSAEAVAIAIAWEARIGRPLSQADLEWVEGQVGELRVLRAEEFCEAMVAQDAYNAEAGRDRTKSIQGYRRTWRHRNALLRDQGRRDRDHAPAGWLPQVASL